MILSGFLKLENIFTSSGASISLIIYCLMLLKLKNPRNFIVTIFFTYDLFFLAMSKLVY